ncbi:MAG: hypothetical protein ACTHU0_00625 [Kofleriaceae bacterium]
MRVISFALLVSLVALLASCAMFIKPAPKTYDNRIDERMATGEVEYVRAICENRVTPESPAEQQRACDVVAASEAKGAERIAQIPCTGFDILPGEGDYGQVNKRLGIQNGPTSAVAQRLQACGRYDDLLSGRFVIASDAGFAFTDAAGRQYLLAAVLDPKHMSSAVRMIVSVVDAENKDRELADLLASRTELDTDPYVFSYLADSRHPHALELLPRYLDSEEPSRRITGCRAVKVLKAKSMRARVEQLAAHDPFVEGGRTASVVWPVRQACQAVLSAVR